MTVSVKEKSCQYPVLLETPMFNEHGAIVPCAYLKITTSVLEEHMEVLQMDVPRLIRRFGVAWVMLSMSTEIFRPIRPADQLYAKTWCSTYAPPIYRRETAFYDPRGKLVAAGAMFFSLLDLKTRRICTDPALHANFDLPVGETLLQASSRFDVDEATLCFDEIEQRQVRPSWIDGLGHVNNNRYGEVAYDAFTNAQRRRTGQLKRLDFWFLHELKQEDVVKVERAGSPDAPVLRGSILSSGAPTFLARFEFPPSERPDEDA